MIRDVEIRRLSLEKRIHLLEVLAERGSIMVRVCVDGREVKLGGQEPIMIGNHVEAATVRIEPKAIGSGIRDNSLYPHRKRAKPGDVFVNRVAWRPY